MPDRTNMLAVVLTSLSWTVPLASRAGILQVPRAPQVRCDADRCYYGNVDADGNTNIQAKDRRRQGPALKPSPSMSPKEMVNAQFEGLARGSQAGVDDAFAFLSPDVISKYGMDVARFRTILQGHAFEGLIGCASWEILSTTEPAENVAVVSLRVLPKPIPGCVRTSGVASQEGITWPSTYKWTLSRRTVDDDLSGCWLLDNMAPDTPPIDVDANEGDVALQAAAPKARGA